MPNFPYQRSGTQWLVSDGLIHDNLPAECRTKSGRPVECHSVLQVLNPHAKPATATVRFYHTDSDPTEIKLAVAAGAIHTLELTDCPGVPHRKPFWITLESDLPLLPQAKHEDFRDWEETPDAMIAVAPYPGPLEDETRWILPDCYQGGPHNWHEQETLTILNPGDRPVEVKLRYVPRGRDSWTGQKIKINPRRVAWVRLWEQLPAREGKDNGLLSRLFGDYAIYVEADGPVIPQVTRRAYWRGFPQVIGSRSVIGYPLREGQAHDLWYYPAGQIVGRGILPPALNCDVTWNLLFTRNLSPQRPTTVEMTFHQADGGTTRAAATEIGADQTHLDWLHLKPWLGTHTQVGPPWGVTVRSQGPVIVASSCAEFEMWSNQCPGAMAASTLYPGPLTDERTWWLGISATDGGEKQCARLEYTWHLFNPGNNAAHVQLTVHGLGGAARPGPQVTVPAGGIAALDAGALGELPVGGAFAVRADSDEPICAHAICRSFVRGLVPTHGMYGHLGLPMRLTLRV
ncbi:MAG: hypothetical protein IT443_09030 [Phycisphaeraceae bacterium]|nr:hypothetical protein [Phycisphaeraceae bacterium]